MSLDPNRSVKVFRYDKDENGDEHAVEVGTFDNWTCADAYIREEIPKVRLRFSIVQEAVVK